MPAEDLPRAARGQTEPRWWRDAVVYQVYPRSFQDSDGDGTGDLRGVRDRLGYLEWLGVDALWLSPVYPSPMADFGYDVSDYEDVDPVYGSLAELDALVEAAHGRGLRVLMDLVPCHTSIEHPWFRERPDFYVWREGPGPPNNWRATFGGPAWTYDEARGAWYLHSFFAEQPDLDWRNPEVVRAMQDVVRFWLARGVDGFRLDAIDRLGKDPQLRDDPPATEPFGLPLGGPYGELAHVHSTNSDDIGDFVGALREAAGDAFLVGEVYLPTARLEPYTRHLDAAFCFEFVHAPLEAAPLRAVIEAAIAAGGLAWVLSNHDFVRLATRFGPERTRAAALLLLTLPGPAFVYHGDEIGLADGPGADPPQDRFGRDGARHPMQWDASEHGGFTTGEPWLPAVDPARVNVAGQREDPLSLLTLYRTLIALRPRLDGPLRFRDDAAEGVLAYERGDRLVAMNLTDRPRPAPGPRAGPALLVTHPDPDGDPDELAPWAGSIT
jgi:alpha-glucosidase